MSGSKASIDSSPYLPSGTTILAFGSKDTVLPVSRRKHYFCCFTSAYAHTYIACIHILPIKNHFFSMHVRECKDAMTTDQCLRNFSKQFSLELIHFQALPSTLAGRAHVPQINWFDSLFKVNQQIAGVGFQISLFCPSRVFINGKRQ